MMEKIETFSLKMGKSINNNVPIYLTAVFLLKPFRCQKKENKYFYFLLFLYLNLCHKNVVFSLNFHGKLAEGWVEASQRHICCVAVLLKAHLNINNIIYSFSFLCNFEILAFMCHTHFHYQPKPDICFFKLRK